MTRARTPIAGMGRLRTARAALNLSCFYYYYYYLIEPQIGVYPVTVVIQCVPLAGSPGKCWFTERTKVQYICIHTCNEVRLCVLGIRKKEVGNMKR
jgi:hypothetical protein